MAKEQLAKEERQEDTLKGRFLTFSLGEDTFGVEIRHVTEIIGMQPISGLPETPDYILGIINLRGRIIPVVDMRRKFKLKEIAYTDRTCIVVIDLINFSVGLIVDHVAEVITIEEGNVAPPPDAKTGISNRYIRGIGKAGNEVKLLLDCERLFDGEQMLQEEKTEKNI